MCNQEKKVNTKMFSGKIKCFPHKMRTYWLSNIFYSNSNLFPNADKMYVFWNGTNLSLTGNIYFSVVLLLVALKDFLDFDYEFFVFSDNVRQGILLVDEMIVRHWVLWFCFEICLSLTWLVSCVHQQTEF